MVFLFRTPRFVDAYAFRIRQGDVKENLFECSVLLPRAHLRRISMNNVAIHLSLPYQTFCKADVSFLQSAPFKKNPHSYLMINLRESDFITIAVSANYVFRFSKH